MSAWGEFLVGLAAVSGGATGVAVTTEIAGSSKWLSRRLLHLAVRKVPERRRDVRREEWTAEWEAFDGSVLARLGWALSLYIGQSRKALRHREKTVQAAKPAITENWDVFLAHELGVQMDLSGTKWSPEEVGDWARKMESEGYKVEVRETYAMGLDGPLRRELRVKRPRRF